MKDFKHFGNNRHNKFRQKKSYEDGIVSSKN
jgi:hypothetical protein